MKENKDEKNSETLKLKKKVYISPRLIKYGKLTKLTGGAITAQNPENSGQGGSTNTTRHRP